MDERRLHSPAWIESVGRVRARVNMPTGRLPSTTPAPGVEYQRYVEEQYREELLKWNYRPPNRELKRMRKTVLRRAERQFPPESRGELKPKWYLDIEAEKPWQH